MTRTILMALAWLALATVAHADSGTKVTPLLSKELKDLPGKEGLMLTVEFAPGQSDPIHRHDAHVFVYVLEGSIVMQVKGGPETTLKVGETFYESPEDIHVVGKNASATEPAKFLVFFVKNKDKAPVLPAD
jgi:quercetin dioxygenase-like cupin family protein